MDYVDWLQMKSRLESDLPLVEYRPVVGRMIKVLIALVEAEMSRELAKDEGV